MKYKQVLVLRADLGMSKGKMISQAAHVSVLAALKAMKRQPDMVMEWIDEGYKKIACKVNSLEELLSLERKANEAGIDCAIVEDFGLTEVEPGTITAVAIGPAHSDDVDSITRQLKLL